MNIRRALFTFTCVVSTAAVPALTYAQQRDTVTSVVPLPTKPGPRTSTIVNGIPDSLRRPPIAPRRAFLLSLIIPGYAQSRLGRPASSMIFATAEIFALGMARKAAQDLREAKMAPKDSVVSAYAVDATTGALTPAAYTHFRFTPQRVRARHTHYEDWIAAIIFNHVISGADAYVAANLWDFNANINPTSKTAIVSARVAF